MSDVAKASDRQSAVRLLACIDQAGTPITNAYWGPDVVAVLHAESRLQALDFWMRNPDYLANELLNAFEESGDDTFLGQAKLIFDDREPDLRRLPMVRWHFGAFEPINDALALLRSADLVIIRRTGVPGHVREHNYLLTRKGRAAMADLAGAAPELAWYRDRARLVATVAGASGGKALKDRQYLQQEYRQTELKRVIAPITERVRARLNELLGR